MTDKILLGFEVGTGKEVYLPMHHTVVTGMTRLSGKTTCLEALIKRGDITAVAFLTKRGEKSFAEQRTIQPYFKEQKRGDFIDWQYVESLLEATMGEKMKIERSFIIDCCNGSAIKKIPPAHSLEEVYSNFKEAQKDAKRGLDQSIYTNLAAYFEIILPQLRKIRFAEKLDLQKGFNVMNLIGMRIEMQQLVIESVFSYVLTRLEHVVIVLPEAHKFIPQGSKTPVKNTAVRFIQEGAVLGNYLWVDTQVTTTVDKDLLKQCSNWIMGYQQERNEVTNVRENIGKHKITDEDIMSLKLGHFMASLQQDLYHVYVLPLGIDLEVGRAVALGKIRVEEVRDSLRMKSEGIIAPRAPKAPREVRPEDLEVFDPEELGKLRIQVTEISRKMIDQEEKYERELQELKQEKWELGEAVEAATGELSELKNEISSLKKDLEIRGAERDRLTQVVGSQDTELSQFRQFKVLLGQILEPLLVTDEELEEIREDLEKLKHQRPTRTRTAPVGDTGIAWIDVWLSKLGPAEQKILRFMAAKFPLKMTKSEIALGIGLTARGGYFSGAFNRLRKNKLIVEAGDGNWKLMEAPG